VASSSSSTKKAAKLAQSSQGKKVRFQGGTLFPFIVTLVVVLGLALVIYARQSRPTTDASAPGLSDHWTHAYGFYLCDEWFQLSGDAEVKGSDQYAAYKKTGVHSGDDGLIHWHAFSSAAQGTKARLGVFLDVYGVELTNDTLTFPEAQRPALPSQQETGVFKEGETKCKINGVEESAELKVVVWDSFADTSKGTTYIADFNNIRLDQDEKVIAIAFVPKNTDVGKPPWTPTPPPLGDTSSTVPGSVPTGSTPANVVTSQPPSTTTG
jgi:hypothetical protein